MISHITNERAEMYDSDKANQLTIYDRQVSISQENSKNKFSQLIEKMDEKKAAYISSLDTSKGSVFPYVQKWIIDFGTYPSFTFSGHKYYHYESLLEILKTFEGFTITNITHTSCGLSEDAPITDSSSKKIYGSIESIPEAEIKDFKYPNAVVAELTFKNKLFYIKLTIAPSRDCSFDDSEDIIKSDNINIACKADVILIHSEDDAVIAGDLMNTFSSAKIKTQDSKKSTINIVIQTSNGYDLVSYDIKDPKMDLTLNYNDDFMPEYEKIIERLNTPKDKDIVMFHGAPGTGKTTLIKHLLSVMTKKVIYIPPDLTASISRPEFIAFLMQHSNSILVIEDAENAILSRGESAGGNQAAVANLLNLSDGILSDALSIQVLCTFNADIGKIDQALLRKGRLISKYEFKALDIEKAKKLADKIGFDSELITQDTRLSEIFSLDEDEYNQEKESAGFKH